MGDLKIESTSFSLKVGLLLFAFVILSGCSGGDSGDGSPRDHVDFSGVA